MDAVLPIFFLAGGEIFLALIAARVALWILLGWRDYRRASAPAPPTPRGPGPGLRTLAGGAQPGGGGLPRLPKAA